MASPSHPVARLYATRCATVDRLRVQQGFASRTATYATLYCRPTPRARGPARPRKPALRPAWTSRATAWGPDDPQALRTMSHQAACFCRSPGRHPQAPVLCCRGVCEGCPGTVVCGETHSSSSRCCPVIPEKYDCHQCRDEQQEEGSSTALPCIHVDRSLG
jgi:hypothetical protein